MNKILKLNCKSYYSLLESTLSIHDIVNHSLVNGFSYASLIDINMTGTLEFYLECKKNNIKPIIGIQIEIEDVVIYIIAKNYEGYLHLIKIISLMHINNYYFDDIKNDNCFIITEKYMENLDDNNYYCNDQTSDKYLPFFKANSLSNNVDILYLLSLIKNEKKINEFEWNNLFFDNSTSLDKEVIIDSDIGLNNYQNLIDNINLEIIFSQNNIASPIELKPEEKKLYFKQLLNNKLKSFFANNPDTKDESEKYIDRLKYEYSLIEKKNFIDYFLLVSDITNYCYDNDILFGFGRGSAAGSLVCFLLGITKIDPIKNELIFERFLNENRTSMPDIDLDIMDTKRDTIADYLSNKYGEYNVAHILTISKFKIKVAIRDICRVLSISTKIADSISKAIPNYSEITLEQLLKSKTFAKIYEQYKSIIKLAFRLVNIPRQFSTHAAGVVVSNKKIYEICPIIPCLENKFMTQYPMEYLEEIGLIKIDLLGLRNLTTIKEIIDSIYAKSGYKIDLNKISYEDEKVFKMLAEGNTNGIFQFESPGMTKLIKDIQPKCIEDLAITSSLYRPGASGHIKTFLNNRNNPDLIDYIHPDLYEILQPTYGAVIYQEQIINIVQKIANFNKNQSENFRKSITKKNSLKLIELKNEFLTSAMKNGYSEAVAEQIFEFMLSFASYGFNRSHAISYATLSYQLAYLKCFFPEYFYTHLLSNSVDKEKIPSYFNECKNRNMIFITPSLTNSVDKYYYNCENIYMSILSIKGIGNEVIKTLLSLKKILLSNFINDPIRTISFLYKNNIGQKSLELLIKAGVFDNLVYSREDLLNNIAYIISKDLSLKDLNGDWLFNIDIEAQNNIDIKLYQQWEKELYGLELSLDLYTYYYGIYAKQYNVYPIGNSSQYSLIYVDGCIITNNKSGNLMIKITATRFNKKLYLYKFDDIENIESKKYYLCKLEKFKQNNQTNYDNSYIVKELKKV